MYMVLLLTVLIDSDNEIFPHRIEPALGKSQRISYWLNDFDGGREDEMHRRHFVENRFIDGHILFQIVGVCVLVQTECICCLHLR